MQQPQEIAMFTSNSRNPIARSFGIGVNQPQVIPDRRRRRVKRVHRHFEIDDG